MYKKAQTPDTEPKLTPFAQQEKNQYESMVGNTLMGGLGGAAIGGLGLGLNRWLESPREEDAKTRRAGIIRQALLGSVLGGAGGASIPLAQYAMRNRDEPPTPPNWVDKNIGAPVGHWLGRHPLTAIAPTITAGTHALMGHYKSFENRLLAASQKLTGDQGAAAQAFHSRIMANMQAAKDARMGNVHDVRFQEPLKNDIASVAAQAKAEPSRIKVPRPIETPPPLPNTIGQLESLADETVRARTMAKTLMPRTGLKAFLTHPRGSLVTLPLSAVMGYLGDRAVGFTDRQYPEAH